MMQIQNYKIIPVGRSKDLSNQQFGDYRVLYRTEVPSTSKSKQAHWLCQCTKCNKYVIKPAFTLTKGINECECKYDLTNKIFGKWTVIEKAKSRNNKGYWKCKCVCGNEKEVESYLLTSGQSKSCGCYQKELAAKRCKQGRIDLTGQRFGKLVALYPMYSGEKNIHTKWHCQCDCGNFCDIDMGNLRRGKSQSCGCVNSKNEEKIIKLLTKNNISFEYQIDYLDLPNKKFDFHIGTDLEKGYIIEYDGQQHFFYTGSGWDTQEHYERTHTNDLQKNHYCFRNSIPIIRIPYDAEYTIDDLKLETTRFLLTPENEEEYYASRKR